MSLRKLPEIKAFQHSDILQFDAPDDAVEQFNAEIQAAGDQGDNVIAIYGPIGRDPFTDVDNTERRISAALRSIGRKDVTVNVNSPGGNFLSGLAIYNLLRAHPAKVTVNVLAMAGSAASVIAMAGDEVLMADGAFIMVHNASAVVMGNKYDAKDAVELLAEVDDGMAEIYAARAGVTKAEAAGWMDKGRGKGTMFNASAAIERGLADGKLPAGAIKVSADASKRIPVERVIERALTARGLSSAEAKATVSELKSGMRDAAANVTRDADGIKAAIERLRTTIRT
ncbi:head maturation protease, ClpP-related [Azospirillum sp. SYSU D00513]|uniref:head maturation protease, ClpP-related n=1 Tax=Azospirillum sp. SYSU D00513 TaxID=2812561 RepID=UPI001A9722CA|nr:head maturation protease, ClpP-related [Azospirillum sp. SYSU D00513]